MRDLLTVLVGVVLLAAAVVLAPNAAAYPDTKEECDAAGGTWASSGDSGFCFMELEPMGIAHAPGSAGTAKGCAAMNGIYTHGPVRGTGVCTPVAPAAVVAFLVP